ncbi:MAG: transposase [Mariprofundus sp.]|nr:transposase [Mariprofundus sp.]
MNQAASAQLYTRIGKLILRVPQCRAGKFSTSLFSRYQRSEQALVFGYDGDDFTGCEYSPS